MGLTQKLAQKQGQLISLTPQLRQAIKLLEISNIELTDYLNQVVLENPVLAMDDIRTEQENIAPAEKSSADELAPLDHYDYENLWTNDNPGSLQSTFQIKDTFHNGDINNDFQLAAQVPQQTLREYLQSQVNSTFNNDVDRFIASSFIENLDEGGYLIVPLEDIASQMKCEPEKIEEVLGHVQEFEPAGVFARSPVECIALQLKDRHLLDHETQLFLNHIQLFVEGKFERLMKYCGVDSARLESIIHNVRQCDPKPGLKYGSPSEEILIPDVLTFWNPATDKWEVRLNEGVLPRLYIDENTFKRTQGHKDIRKYLQEQLSSASWLIKALEQRTRTIQKVAEAIVEHQQDFFSKGIRFLKPLNLKMIAEIVDMHESTISRTTQNKYMATPRGNFELKYFFSGAIASMYQHENAHSAESVRHVLADLIAGENPSDPYSDDQLVHMLAQKGIDIARRTIAKYREEIGIPTSYLRRRRYAHQNLL